METHSLNVTILSAIICNELPGPLLVPAAPPQRRFVPAAGDFSAEGTDQSEPQAPNLCLAIQ